MTMNFLRTNGALLIATCVFLGCKKQEVHIPIAVNMGNSTAMLNGAVWRSTKISAYPISNTDFFEISLEGPERTGYGYSLNFVFVQFKPQTITGIHSIEHMVQGHSGDVHRFDTAYATAGIGADGGDLARYYVDQNATLPSYVMIDKSDTVTGHVSGRFQVTLYKQSEERPPASRDYIDTLRFTDGVFELMYK